MLCSCEMPFYETAHTNVPVGQEINITWLWVCMCTGSGMCKDCKKGLVCNNWGEKTGYAKV